MLFYAVEQMAGEVYVTAEFIRRWDAVEYAMTMAPCFTDLEMKAHPKLAPALERWLSRDLESYSTRSLQMGMVEIREGLSEAIQEVADGFLDSFADLADEPTVEMWSMCKAAGETLRKLEEALSGLPPKEDLWKGYDDLSIPSEIDADVAAIHGKRDAVREAMKPRLAADETEAVGTSA